MMDTKDPGTVPTVSFIFVVEKYQFPLMMSTGDPGSLLLIVSFISVVEKFQAP